MNAVHRFSTLVVTHGHQTIQGLQYRGGIPGRQQVGQVLHRDTQALHIRQHAAVGKHTGIRY
ncbi:hypothetical protein D3C86_2100540 [compost metagenome]